MTTGYLMLLHAHSYVELRVWSCGGSCQAQIGRGHRRLVERRPKQGAYSVVIIKWARYLGPPGPSTSQILGTCSRFSEDFLGRERGPREDPLGSGRIP